MVKLLNKTIVLLRTLFSYMYFFVLIYSLAIIIHEFDKCLLKNQSKIDLKIPMPHLILLRQSIIVLYYYNIVN